jgi:hypothetical protein
MLTALQHQVIYDMVALGNWTAATQKAGLPLRTLAGWLLDAEFRAEYQRFQRDVLAVAEPVLERVSSRAEALVMVLLEVEEFGVSELLESAIGILERVEQAIEHVAEFERAHNEFLSTL